MRLTVPEREALRKRVKNVLPQVKKSEIVNYFAKKIIPRKIIYNTINRFETDQLLKEKKKSRRPTTWTAYKKTISRDWSITALESENLRLAKKFGVHQSTIGSQLDRMAIPYRKRAKSIEYNPK